MIYILGERPGPNTDPSRPLYPHTSTGAAARLIRLLHMTQEEYIAGTLRLNAVDDSSSTASAGARLRVENFLREAGSNPFIVCGKQALRAMPPEYRKLGFGDVLNNVILIPHPSGVNRLWNDPEFTQAMMDALKQHMGRRMGADETLAAF